MANLQFKNGLEMYNYIVKGFDLYNKKLGIYLFVYNDAGALCKYSLLPEKVYELIKTRQEFGESWSSFLGVGGLIYDNTKYDTNEYRYVVDSEIHQLYIQPSLDLCEELYCVDGWVNTQDLTSGDMICIMEE